MQKQDFFFRQAHTYTIPSLTGGWLCVPSIGEEFCDSFCDLPLDGMKANNDNKINTTQNLVRIGMLSPLTDHCTDCDP